MSLLPLNASPLERHLASVMARTEALPIRIDTLWNPDTCPENLLPWLAWALSVDTWDSNWSVEVKRQLIADSIRIHRTKGTVAAVERVIEALGVNAELAEWFDYEGPPYTFRLTAWANANNTPDVDTILTPSLYDSIKNTVDNVKPVRAHYDFRVGAALCNGININGIATASNAVRVHANAENNLNFFTPTIFPVLQTRGYSVIRIVMETT